MTLRCVNQMCRSGAQFETSLVSVFRGVAVAQALARNRLSKVSVTKVANECCVEEYLEVSVERSVRSSKRRSRHVSSWTTLLELTKGAFPRPSFVFGFVASIRFVMLSCFKRQKAGPWRIISPNRAPNHTPQSYPLRSCAARCYFSSIVCVVYCLHINHRQGYLLPMHLLLLLLLLQVLLRLLLLLLLLLPPPLLHSSF